MILRMVGQMKQQIGGCWVWPERLLDTENIIVHDHAHHVGYYNQAFSLGVTLNLGFLVVEVFFGILLDSLALLADAGHNLSGVAGLLLTWGASSL